MNAIIKPLPSIIPSSIRGSLEGALTDYFQTSLKKVHLCDLKDNLEFFGQAQKDSIRDGQKLYGQFLQRQYPHLADDPALRWEILTDASLLKGLKR